MKEQESHAITEGNLPEDKTCITSTDYQKPDLNEDLHMNTQKRMRASLQLCVSESSVCAKRVRLKKLPRDTEVWLTHFTLLNTQHEDPVQEWGEEVEDGVVYGVTLHREPACPSPSGQLGVGCMQYRTLKVRRVKAAMLEHLVTELVKPQCDEPDYARIFLSTYRAFTCTNTLINMLFQ
ncbi:ral guanine nucleotide dissociation stimulator-like 1 isoform X3, partial [Silurus meridionalis]